MDVHNNTPRSIRPELQMMGSSTAERPSGFLHQAPEEGSMIQPRRPDALIAQGIASDTNLIIF